MKKSKTALQRLSKEKYSRLTLVQRVDYLVEMIEAIHADVKKTRQTVERRKAKSAR
jgi:hypothetical protein